VRLPYILHPFYRYMRDVVPEPIKPTTRGLYNMANKFLTYGRTDIFTALDMEINSDCNMRCSYCPISIEGRGATLMPEALFLTVLQDLSDFPYKGRISPHFYGEPTLDGRLVRLMQIARDRAPEASLVIHLRRCFYLSDEIAITHDGEVVCTNDFHITESFGNVHTQHLLRDIWWGERFTKLRARLRNGHFDLDVCKKCSGVKESKSEPTAPIKILPFAAD
jgi:MoaA/NifB/PqqE/SkfB family radical SAM enzyme